MTRSLKKGPFVDHHLMAKVDKAAREAQAKGVAVDELRKLREIREQLVDLRESLS